MNTEGSKLADLTRELLGAKGVHDMVKSLLDELPRERKDEILGQIIFGAQYELRQRMVDLLEPELKQIALEMRERVVEVIRTQLATQVDDIAKDAAHAIHRNLRDTCLKIARGY